MREFSFSTMQREWLVASGEPVTSAFHTTQLSLSFGETLEPAALRAAWDYVAASQAALRTAFRTGKTGDVECMENDEAAVEWRELDWRSFEGAALATAWNKLTESDAAQPIAQAPGPSARLCLITLPDGCHHLLWSFHAASLDDASVFLVLRQWLDAYDQLRTGESIAPAVPVSVADALSRLPQRSVAEDESFWSRELKERRPIAPFQAARRRPAESASSEVRRTVARIFERNETTRLRQTADALGCEIFILVQAAWAALFARGSGEPIAAIVRPVATRAALDAAAVAGRFESLLPERIAVPDTLRIREWTSALVEHNGQLAAGALSAYADISKARVVAPRAFVPHAAFISAADSLNDLLHRYVPRWMAADVRLIRRAPFSITLEFTDSDRAEATLHFAPDRTTPSEASSLLARWEAILNRVVDYPDALVGEIRMLLPSEDAVVHGGESRTVFRSIVPRPLHEILEEIAAEIPNQAAVEKSPESLTFGELNSYANQLARFLRKKDVQAGKRIAVCLSRTPWWPVAVFGALKAGCSAVLFDPTAEPDRLKRRLRAAGASAILSDTSAALPDDLPEMVGVVVDAEWPAISEEKARNLQPASSLEQEALAWFDQRPKVNRLHVFPHSALVAAFAGAADLFSLNPTDRVLQFASTHTAAGLEELFATILSGATLVMRPEDLSTRTAFQEFVGDQRVSILRLPAAFWSQWAHYLSELSIAAPASLRGVSVEGWRVLAPVVAAWQRIAPSVDLVTRFCDDTLARAGLASHASASLPPSWPVLPLGSPQSGIEAFVADREGRPMPLGFCGGLRLRRPPAETSLDEGAAAEKPAPRKAPEPEPTGMTAFCDTEGIFHPALYYPQPGAGDNSDRVCQRIELALVSHPDVFDALATFRKDGEKTVPWAWIVPRESDRGEPADLRDHLASVLPEDFQPARIGCLPRLPLSIEGELDVAALPDPPEEPARSDISPARGGGLEERLSVLVVRTLGRSRVGLDETVTDTRTKSHLAGLLCEAATREGLRVKIEDFQQTFTIRSLAQTIRARDASPDDDWTPLVPMRITGDRPPIFLVHDYDGRVEPYAALVHHLGDDQPCHAITARGLQHADRCHRTIPEMAKAYVEAVRLSNPDGPYRLIGAGFGGLVAWEMALQLDAASVALLALLGTEPPIPNKPKGGPDFIGHLTSLFGGKSRKAAVPQPASKERPIFQCNLEAASQYRARRSPVEAHIFLPESSTREAETRWAALAENARIYQAPCIAEALLEEPAVTTIAAALRKLAAAEELTDEVEA
jgi:non-ribosomal peptide synthetase component F